MVKATSLLFLAMMMMNVAGIVELAGGDDDDDDGDDFGKRKTYVSGIVNELRSKFQSPKQI